MKGRSKSDGQGRLGGRAKGTPNKVTGAVREYLGPFMGRYIDGEGIGRGLRKLEDDLNDMTPADRARIMVSLVPYVIPKLTSVEVKDTPQRKTFQQELDEMMEES